MMRHQLSLVIALSLAAVPTAAQDQAPRSMRFAAMDVNRDGVITRKEWRGSAQSFQVHDWNRDGVLSGDEVRVGARRSNDPRDPDPFDSDQQEYPFTDWTASGFRNLDHDRNGRVTRDEWHFDLEDFRRADHNGDGWISRAEFLGGDSTTDDDRNDRFDYLDTNRDGRVSRAEWHGTADRFAALDDNRDGVLSRAEIRGGNEPPADLFTSVDVNRDNVITPDEWHWSRTSFDQRDANRDRRLSRNEFSDTALSTRSAAYRQGYERGLVEGRQAGREDKQNGVGWDLEGQRELEQADSGYQASFGPRSEYQAGYRGGFRRGYREGFGSSPLAALTGSGSAPGRP
jgi:Ca2+-binding EF-hand superfamily protein